MDRIDGAFLVLTIGATEEPDGWVTQREHADRVLDAVEPWGTGALYLSMVDDQADERRAVPSANWQRLSRVRSAADPDRLFVLPHTASVGAGEAPLK